MCIWAPSRTKDIGEFSGGAVRVAREQRRTRSGGCNPVAALPGRGPKSGATDAASSVGALFSDSAASFVFHFADRRPVHERQHFGDRVEGHNERGGVGFHRNGPFLRQQVVPERGADVVGQAADEAVQLYAVNTPKYRFCNTDTHGGTQKPRTAGCEPNSVPSLPPRRADRVLDATAPAARSGADPAREPFARGHEVRLLLPESLSHPSRKRK